MFLQNLGDEMLTTDVELLVRGVARYLYNLHAVEQGSGHRVQYNEIPPRVEYSVTDIARELQAALKAMGEWGEKLSKYRQEHPAEAGVE